MTLNSAGTALTVNRSGFYNITFGVDAYGIISNPEVAVYVNSNAAQGTRLRISSTNHMNSLTKILFLRSGDVITLRGTNGTIMLQSGHVNAFLDVIFIGDRDRDRDRNRDID
jgi:hypothetical protein